VCSFVKFLLVIITSKARVFYLIQAAENLPSTAMEEEAAPMEIFHVDEEEPVEQLENQSVPQDPLQVNDASLTRQEEETVDIPPISIEAEMIVPKVSLLAGAPKRDRPAHVNVRKC